MLDVIAFGEMLIDFVPTVTGVTLIEAPAFVKAPGGAPANVAVGLARLGLRSGFMGQVGDDAFGHFLANTLAADGVDLTGLRFTSEARTALAFVSLKADGDRDFMFYRHPSADMLLTAADVDESLLKTARAFHFGSISLIGEPSRSATLHAIETATAAGALISYDPNLRLPLWPSAEAARTGMLSAWPLAQVIKVSEEELTFLTGLSDMRQAAASLWHPALKLLLVTQGGSGCAFITTKASGSVPSFPVQAVDATGAGDAFMAAMLKGLLERANLWNDEAALREACRYANAAGALTTTQRGAIPALPTAAQVADFVGRA